MQKKLFLVALATLGLLVACGQQPADEPSSSKKPAEPSNTSIPASSAADASSAAPATDWTVVVPHTWVDGTPAQNSDNKEYIPLTDAAAGKVGVKISIQNYTVESDATEGTTLDGSGKIGPVNDNNAIITYKVKAPKAGDYQLVMRGKSKSDALDRTLDGRALTVKLNGEAVDIQGDRAPLLETDIDFVVAPTIALTGQEDTIKIGCPNYRIQFDVASFLLFQEH